MIYTYILAGSILLAAFIGWQCYRFSNPYYPAVYGRGSEGINIYVERRWFFGWPRAAKKLAPNPSELYDYDSQPMRIFTVASLKIGCSEQELAGAVDKAKDIIARMHDDDSELNNLKKRARKMLK